MVSRGARGGAAIASSQFFHSLFFISYFLLFLRVSRGGRGGAAIAADGFYLGTFNIQSSTLNVPHFFFFFSSLLSLLNSASSAFSTFCMRSIATIEGEWMAL